MARVTRDGDDIPSQSQKDAAKKPKRYLLGKTKEKYGKGYGEIVSGDLPGRYNLPEEGDQFGVALASAKAATGKSSNEPFSNDAMEHNEKLKQGFIKSGKWRTPDGTASAPVEATPTTQGAAPVSKASRKAKKETKATPAVIAEDLKERGKPESSGPTKYDNRYAKDTIPAPKAPDAATAATARIKAAAASIEPSNEKGDSGPSSQAAKTVERMNAAKAPKEDAGSTEVAPEVAPAAEAAPAAPKKASNIPTDAQARAKEIAANKGGGPYMTSTDKSGKSLPTYGSSEDAKDAAWDKKAGRDKPGTTRAFDPSKAPDSPKPYDYVKDNRDADYPDEPESPTTRSSPAGGGTAPPPPTPPSGEDRTRVGPSVSTPRGTGRVSTSPPPSPSAPSGEDRTRVGPSVSTPRGTGRVSASPPPTAAPWAPPSRADSFAGTNTGDVYATNVGNITQKGSGRQTATNNSANAIGAGSRANAGMGSNNTYSGGGNRPSVMSTGGNAFSDNADDNVMSTGGNAVKRSHPRADNAGGAARSTNKAGAPAAGAPAKFVPTPMAPADLTRKPPSGNK